jgi:hypothetical protein
MAAGPDPTRQQPRRLISQEMKMDNYLQEKIQYLALYRRDLVKIEATLKGMQAEFSQSETVVSLKESQKVYKNLVDTYTQQIKKFGIEVYPGDPDHPAVKTKEMTEVTIDEVAALEK